MMSRMASHGTRLFTPTLCIERGTMKITTIKLLALALAITVCAGGALLLLPNPSHAQVVCPATGDTGDADADGFTNDQECTGIGLGGGGSVPLCVGAAARNSCVDPNSKDVFVIVAPAGGSLLGANPLEILNRTGTGSLGIAIHQITDTDAPSRQVTTSQNAIRIAESLDTADITTGICNQGTPNDADGCVVYTQRIVNFLNSKCPAAVVCQINGLAGQQQVATIISAYIKNTIAHEAAHSMALGATYDSRFGGNHYQTGTNVVMDQSVYYTSKGKNPVVRTFFLPGNFAAADPPAAKLR